jgi:hypothetical protein
VTKPSDVINRDIDVVVMKEQATDPVDTPDTGEKFFYLKDGDIKTKDETGAIDDYKAHDPTPPPAIEAVVWRGNYNAANTYLKNDMVLDEPWLMIANKDTSDRPAPQPNGNAEWLTGYDDSPPFTDVNETTSQLLVGIRITHNTSRYLNALRWWHPVADEDINYNLWMINDAYGANKQVISIATGLSYATTGWKEYPLGNRVMEASTVAEFFLEISNPVASIPTNFTGVWDYKRSDGDPPNGELWHQSVDGGGEMRIPYIDRNSADHEANIRTIRPGDEIEINGTTWVVSSITSLASSIATLQVTPAARTVDGIYNVNFTNFSAVVLPYVRDIDYWSPDPNVLGLWSINGYAGMLGNNNAYNLDVKIQSVLKSSDWDIASSMGAV